MSEIVSVPEAEIRKNFSHFQDEALRRPVLISTGGRTKTVLLSFEEFARLKAQDRRVYDVESLPDEVATAILAQEVPSALPE